MTPAGWLSSEVKAPTTELIAEFTVICVADDVVRAFIDDCDEQEEAEEDDQESKEALSFICRQYEVEPETCIPFPDAVVVGNLIRQTMFEEDIDELLSWCFKKLEESRGTRADILNLIAYLHRWYLQNLDTAAKYFRMSAVLGYPLAMANLAQSDVPDREEWEAKVAKSGYYYFWTE